MQLVVWPKGENLLCIHTIFAVCHAAVLGGQTPPPTPTAPSQFPSPPDVTTPTPPQTFTFRVTGFQGIKPASANLLFGLNFDSDYATVYCKVNGVDQPLSPATGTEVHIKQGGRSTAYHSCNVQVGLQDDVEVGFYILNSGNNGLVSAIAGDAVAVIAAVVQNYTSASSTSSDRGSNWGSILSTTLGAAQGAFSNINLNCDGVVAADALKFKGEDIHAVIAGGYLDHYARSYYRSLCGNNAQYTVWFQIMNGS